MDLRPAYERLLEGTQDGSRQVNVHFYVYSTSLEDGRGDVFVALGLARALDAIGWGVSFANQTQWQLQPPETTTVTISMLPTADAKSAPAHAIRIGWARNAIQEWAAQDSINFFDGMFVSSSAGLSCLNEVYLGPSEVMPIAVDPELFFTSEDVRSNPIVTTVNYWNQSRGLISDLKCITPPAEIHWYGKNLENIEVASDQVLLENPVSYLDVPAIYRSSRFVLDDLTIASREHGCHNSRLFEGLASGALVLTNESEGLEELGLAKTPVFGGAESLQSLLEELIFNEPERVGLVAELREEVLARHTFAHRAEQIAGFVSGVKRTYSSRRKLLEARHRTLEEIEVAAIQNDELRKRLVGAQLEIRRFRSRFAVRVADKLQKRATR